MKIELPKDLTALEADALGKLFDDVLAEYKELDAIDVTDLTDEQVDDLEALGAAGDAINAENATRQAAQDERANRVAAAKAKLNDARPEEGDDGDGDGEESEEAAGEDEGAEENIEVPDDASELVEKEAVTASAAAPVKRPITRRVAAKAPAPKDADRKPAQRAALIASADVDGFSTGQELKDLDGVTQAFLNRMNGLPTHKMAGKVTNKYGVAQLRKGVNPEFQLERGQHEANASRITKAAREFSLDESGSMVAGGGWCAPSETIYDLNTLETVSGILQLPEVTMPRGGISFTKGPDFSDIYTDSGFLQTEAQAEAETVKNFIDVECPGFEEVRLDAIGFGVRAGILTNATWPELVRRYVEGTEVAHAHKVNATKINRIATLAGTAVNANELGAAVPDSLSALEMQAVRLRYKYRLGENTPVEGFAPIWFLSVLRQDLAYQEGVTAKAITAAQVNSWLSARNISLQWVYDYQDLAATGTTWPATVQVILYPRGTYVAGTLDVINLSVVHDTASLSINTFTAAFFEEGIAVFNPLANGVKVEIALTAYGRSGAHDITNLVAA